MSFYDADDETAQGLQSRGIDYDLYSCLEYNRQDFVIGDIKQVHAVWEGERDRDSWVWVLELYGQDDSTWLVLEGSCDDTGWDCQSSAWVALAAATLPALFNDLRVQGNELIGSDKTDALVEQLEKGVLNRTMHAQLAGQFKALHLKQASAAVEQTQAELLTAAYQQLEAQLRLEMEQLVNLLQYQHMEMRKFKGDADKWQRYASRLETLLITHTDGKINLPSAEDFNRYGEQVKPDRDAVIDAAKQMWDWEQKRQQRNAGPVTGPTERLVIHETNPQPDTGGSFIEEQSEAHARVKFRRANAQILEAERHRKEIDEGKLIKCPTCRMIHAPGFCPLERDA